jgi:hypothetical protein
MLSANRGMSRFGKEPPAPAGGAPPNNNGGFPSASMFNMIVQAINYLHLFSNLIYRKGQGFWKKIRLKQDNSTRSPISSECFLTSQNDPFILQRLKNNVFCDEYSGGGISG